MPFHASSLLVSLGPCACACRQVSRLQRTLAADDPTLKPPTARQDQGPPAPTPVVRVSVGAAGGPGALLAAPADAARLTAAVAAEPTPAAAGFHLALLADAAATVAELIKQQPSDHD